VSISASRSVVVYGQTVNLSGSVSNQQVGEKVTVMSEASDKTAFSDLATVDTLAGAAWRYTATPTIAYQAKWKGTLSRAATVKVRPAITLKLVNAATGGFSVTVAAARSFAGKFVLVQRLATTGVSTLKHVTLGAGSAASFSVPLHHGVSRLRVVMPDGVTHALAEVHSTRRARCADLRSRRLLLEARQRVSAHGRRPRFSMPSSAFFPGTCVRKPRKCQPLVRKALFAGTSTRIAKLK